MVPFLCCWIWNPSLYIYISQHVFTHLSLNLSRRSRELTGCHQRELQASHTNQTGSSGLAGRRDLPAPFWVSTDPVFFPFPPLSAMPGRPLLRVYISLVEVYFNAAGRVLATSRATLLHGRMASLMDRMVWPPLQAALRWCREGQKRDAHQQNTPNKQPQMNQF